MTWRKSKAQSGKCACASERWARVKAAGRTCTSTTPIWLSGRGVVHGASVPFEVRCGVLARERVTIRAWRFEPVGAGIPDPSPKYRVGIASNRYVRDSWYL